jgi:hypothetical protein
MGRWFVESTWLVCHLGLVRHSALKRRWRRSGQRPARLLSAFPRTRLADNGPVKGGSRAIVRIASPTRNGLVNTSRGFTNDLRLWDGVLKWIREARCEPRSQGMCRGESQCGSVSWPRRFRARPPRCAPLRFAQSAEMVKVLMEHEAEARCGHLPAAQSHGAHSSR